ncbi:MAG: vWA domain-containing protein [Acidimicrobiales bacterium]
MSMSIMPGGGISKRPLDFFILADCSGSMKTDGKMQALNYAIASMLPHLAAWEQEQEQAEVFARAVAFADSAHWHIAEPTHVTDLRWPPLKYVEKGLTSMGAAFRLVAQALGPGQLQPRALRPAILLITDGKPTDPSEFDAGLYELFALPAGRGSTRMAVAIGRGANSKYLSQFINDPSIPVLIAENAEQITLHLTAVSLAMSRLAEVGANREQIADQLIQSSEHVPEAYQAARVFEEDTIV